MSNEEILNKLKDFIRNKWNQEERCKILSLGDQCECPLCLADNLYEARNEEMGKLAFEIAELKSSEQALKFALELSENENKDLKKSLSSYTENTWYDEKYVNELIRTTGNAQEILINKIELEREKAKKDAIEFVEWIENSGYWGDVIDWDGKKFDSSRWSNDSVNPQFYTTEQLYNIFKQSK